MQIKYEVMICIILVLLTMQLLCTVIFLHEVISSFCQETKNWLQLLFLYDLAFYKSASTVGQNFI